MIDLTYLVFGPQVQIVQLHIMTYKVNSSENAPSYFSRNIHYLFILILQKQVFEFWEMSIVQVKT